MSHRIPVVVAALATLSLVAVAYSPDAPSSKEEKVDEYVRVEVKGRLEDGIVAIGGEHTGTIITAKGIELEVDIGNRQSLRQSIQKLDGRMVVLKGNLQRRRGVEIGERWIVHADQLKAAKSD